MLDAGLTTELERVERQLVEAQSAVKEHPEVDPMLGLYFAVSISGVVEECIEQLLCKRVERLSDSATHSYVQAALHRGFRNPDYAKVKELVSSFNREWVRKLEERIDVDTHGGALSSIVGVKNDIAHGKRARLSMTVSDASAYYKRTRKVLDSLEAILATE